MSNLGAIVGFFLVLVLFSFYRGDNGILPHASSTPNGQSESWEERGESFSAESGTTESPRQISHEEVEERLLDIEEEIGYLREEERQARLLSPRSPYQGLVELRQGNASEERWSREYVTLSASRDASSPIDITGWSLESYVTRERTKIPEGDRVIETYGRPFLERILLLPGEEAYLITGRSPIKVSFHENRCTGYFAEEDEFYPSLRQNCPDPISEMERFSRVAYGNDKCYDFVEQISSCSVPDEELVDEADISNICEEFIEDTLHYNGCVGNHLGTPLFDHTGSWYIYLGRTRDLWRSEREIIRLLDRDGRVVDVVEY